MGRSPVSAAGAAGEEGSGARSMSQSFKRWLLAWLVANQHHTPHTRHKEHGHLTNT